MQKIKLKRFVQVMVFILVSCNINAQSDYLFKNGFENTGSVSGNLTGLSSGEVQIQLVSSAGTERVTLTINGGFAFEQQIPVGTAYAVTISTQPQAQICEVGSNGTGNMVVGGVDDVLVSCQTQSNNWDEMNWDEGVWQ